MAATHLAYPDLALDKLSGTDPDQDAESFKQLIERKINFALGDAPANPDALVNYNFRKKALSSSLLRGPLLNGMELTSKLPPLGKISEPPLLIDSQTDETNAATDLKWSIVFEETEKNFVISFIESKRQ